MSAVGLIGLWASLFIATHLGLASPRVRTRLIGVIGPDAYRGVYSMVALATLIPLIIAFVRQKHAGPLLWYLRDIFELRWLAMLLMAAALVLLAAGLINPNPAAIGAPSNNTPGGVLKVTRHPVFVAFVFFGFAHMLMNGWGGDVLFFGTFAALGIIGGWHQDRRKLSEPDGSYCEFVSRTSFVPGAALWSGRQQWQAADTPWVAIVAGLLVTLLLIALHPLLFGGHPLE